MYASKAMESYFYKFRLTSLKKNRLTFFLILRLILINKFLFGVVILFPFMAFASGVQPETSAVIIYEADKGGSINVKNTEKVPVLLYSKIVDLPDDPTPRLIITQPVARLEPGQTQRVRFVLNTATPLQHEHIKRVYFEGIIEQASDSRQVSITVRQDLPVIIVPKGLQAKHDIWSDLQGTVTNNVLKVTNSGKQVVRLTPQVKVLPDGTALTLRKSYILPGETLTSAAPAGKNINGQQALEIFPVTRYGFDAGTQKIPLTGK